MNVISPANLAQGLLVLGDPFVHLMLILGALLVLVFGAKPRLMLVASISWLPLTGAAVSEEGGRSCVALQDNEICISEANYRADVCTAISVFSRHWNLPEGFFARLIWQESRFDALALSPVGAQGIAQFMPGTARLRALANPFDPAQALASSAQYLDFLKDKFGNLGLAAAAYNGGEGRLERYIGNGGGALPLETRHYVRVITGHPIEYWLSEPSGSMRFDLDPDRDFSDACLEMAISVRAPQLTADATTWRPWGVLIAQRASAQTARSSFERIQAEHENLLGDEPMMLLAVRNPNFGPALRYSAMIGRDTRAEAQALCERLKAAGGHCIVQKNAP